jgi:hypothetical protein
MSVESVVSFQKMAEGNDNDKQNLLKICNNQKNTNCPCEGISSSSESYPSSGNGNGPGCIRYITGRNMVSSSTDHSECLLASLCYYYFPEEMKGASAYNCSNSQACQYNSVPQFKPHLEPHSKDCDTWDLDCINGR